MLTLEMGRYNSIVNIVRNHRKLYTKDELKKHYKFSLKCQCYEFARTYLFALYGIKEPFYSYECKKGIRYAFKYPPIRA